LFMFQQVYFHKSTRAAEWLIRAIVRRAVDLLRDGTPLPARLPTLESVAAGVEPTLADYLELDDGILLGAMHAWEDASDPALADLCKRLRARSLFKTIELGGVESDVDPTSALEIARDVAKQAGLDPDVMVGLDRAEDTPFPHDAGLRVLFPDGRAKDLSEVSFLLARLHGQTLSRVRLVFAPELRARLREALAS